MSQRIGCPGNCQKMSAIVRTCLELCVSATGALVKELFAQALVPSLCLKMSPLSDSSIEKHEG